jgi:hypothetical protein
MHMRLLLLSFSLLLLVLPALGETLTLQPGSELKDANISQVIPEENHAEHPDLWVCYEIYDKGTYWSKGLIEWDLSALPPGAIIQRATLDLYNLFSFGNPVGAVNILRITEPWDEYQVNWNNQPATASEVIATVNWPVPDTWCTFDITQLVKDWRAGIYPNYGIEIVQSDICQHGGVKFASSEDPVAEHHPRLIIEYDTTPGEE